MDEKFKAYLAGLLDGEGSIYIAKKRKAKHGAIYRPHLILVTSSNREFVREVANHLGLGSKVYIHSHLSHIGKKPTWVIDTGKIQEIKNLLEMLKPYLILKRPQAEVMLRFLDAKNLKNLTVQAECYQQMRKLNERGPPRTRE